MHYLLTGTCKLLDLLQKCLFIFQYIGGNLADSFIHQTVQSGCLDKVHRTLAVHGFVGWAAEVAVCIVGLSVRSVL